MWTTQSLRLLAGHLQAKGHKIGHVTVGALLAGQGYSLQGNRKTLEGSSHPDRAAQFQFIAERAKANEDQGQPIISVDTKKKELVGLYKNAGRSYRRKGDPVEVNVHDFVNKELGKVAPYGISTAAGLTDCQCFTDVPCSSLYSPRDINNTGSVPKSPKSLRKLASLFDVPLDRFIAG